MNWHSLLFPDKSERLDDLFNAHAKEQLRNYALARDNQQLQTEVDSLTMEVGDLTAQVEALLDKDD